MKTNLTLTLVKTGILLALVAMCPCAYMIPAAAVIVLTYQYLIALVFKVRVMPSMDMACFFGHDKANTNFMSFTVVDQFDFEKLKGNFLHQMKIHWKLRSCIVEIFGDYYWKETNPEETIDFCFSKIPKDLKDQKEVQDFIEKHLNEEMPFDKPQWKIIMQENYQKKYSILFYKQHHSFSDGVSCISHHLSHAGNNEFDTSKLVPIKKLSFFERMSIRVSFPFRALPVLKKISAIK